jgi:hypothetical protein
MNQSKRKHESHQRPDAAASLPPRPGHCLSLASSTGRNPFLGPFNHSPLPIPVSHLLISIPLSHFYFASGVEHLGAEERTQQQRISDTRR